MNALEIDRVSRDFTTPDGRGYRALDDISLSVAAGSFVAQPRMLVAAREAVPLQPDRTQRDDPLLARAASKSARRVDSRAPARHQVRRWRSEHLD